MNKTIFFEPTLRNISGRDFTEYIFPFRIVDSELIGKTDEMSQSSHHTIKVVVSRTLASCWNFNDGQLHRVLFEYGKRYIIQKLRDGTLRKDEELDLHTANAELPCPFDPSRIENPINAVVELKTTNKKIMEDFSLLQIASAIIDTRDNINAIFNYKHKEKLIILSEERDLLQFFRDAESSEDFFFRLCALANAATKMNIECLRKLTKVQDKQIKSIQLLETYLQNNGILEPRIIETLRNINKIRQAYPVHSDRAKGVLEAHRYFGFEYPVKDCSESWKKLLMSYLQALQQLLEALKSETT